MRYPRYTQICTLVTDINLCNHSLIVCLYMHYGISYHYPQLEVICGVDSYSTPKGGRDERLHYTCMENLFHMLPHANMGEGQACSHHITRNSMELSQQALSGDALFLLQTERWARWPCGCFPSLWSQGTATATLVSLKLGWGFLVWITRKKELKQHLAH